MFPIKTHQVWLYYYFDSYVTEILFVCFLEEVWYQKDILKLTDLY